MPDSPRPAKTQRNPYLVLGVRPTASSDELKAAYRELVKAHHPDHNPDSPLTAATRVKELQEAWEIVSDATRRKEYDALWLRLKMPVEVQAALKKGVAAPAPGFFAKLFGLRPKEGPGSAFHVFFTAAITCFQFPGGKLMEQAGREFRQALQQRPEVWEAKYDLGLTCYWQGSYAEALGFFKEALRQVPDDAACKRVVEALLPID